MRGGGNLLMAQDDELELLIFDRFGKMYDIEDVLFPEYGLLSLGGEEDNTFVCTGENFDVAFCFEEGSGFEEAALNFQERRDVLCQVVSDLASLIVSVGIGPCDGSKPTINIKLNPNDIELPSDAVGAGTPIFYEYNTSDISFKKGVVFGSPWEIINSGVDPILIMKKENSGYYNNKIFHAILMLNFKNYDFNYNLELSTLTPPQKDFYEVILHEMLHILDFLSLIGEDGSCVLKDVVGGNLYYYTYYDTHIFAKDETGNEEYIIKYLDDCNKINFNINYLPYLTDECDINNEKGLYFDSEFWSGDDIPIHTPSEYFDGSSISHIESACYTNIDPYFVMNPFAHETNPLRRPTAEEVAILCDIGYKISGTYGAYTYEDPNLDYSSSSILAAASDPCGEVELYEYCDEPIDFYFDDLLANDQNANYIDFNCLKIVDRFIFQTNDHLEPLYDGNNEIIGFTYYNDNLNDYFYCGQNVIISYIAQNEQGEKTNTEYFYFTLTRCMDGICYEPPIEATCNLICNPKIFEEECEEGLNQLLICDFNGWLNTMVTPDYWTTTFPQPISEGAIGLVVGTNGAVEPAFTPVNLSAGNYLVSYVRYPLIGDYPDAGLGKKIPLNRFIIGGINYNNIVCSKSGDVSLVMNQIDNGELKVLYEETSETLNESNWKQYVSCIKIDETDDINGLYIFPFIKESQPYKEGYMILDHFDLIEDIFIEDQEISFDPNLQTELSLGTDLCMEMTNLVYKWDMLDCSTGEWVSLPEFDNQPLISLTAQDNNLPQNSTKYRLTRTFEKLIDNGVDYDIVIDNSNGCPVEKSAVFKVIVGQTNFTECCYQNSSENYDLKKSDSPYHIINPQIWTSSDNPFNTSGNPRINNDIYVYDNLTISDMTIEFGPKGRIIVASLNTLNINNSVLTGDPSCETMWQGIRTSGDYFAPGKVVLENASIEYAVIGIANHFSDIDGIDFDNLLQGEQSFQAPEGFSIPIWLDQVSVEQINPFNDIAQPFIRFQQQLATPFGTGIIQTKGENYFNDCFHGISIVGDVNSDFYIKGCTFQTTQTHLRFPYDNFEQSEAGIAITNSNGKNSALIHPNDVSIFAPDISDCNFYNLKYGINSYNSNRYSYDNCDFENCLIGISNRNPTTSFMDDINTITNCRFDFFVTAIECDNMAVHIGNNNINMTYDNSSYGWNDNQITQIGIIVASSVFNISLNDIQNVNIGMLLNRNSLFNTASWLLDSDLREITIDPSVNLIYKNRIKHCNVGMNFRQDNSSVQIRCNEFRCYTHYGMMLVGDGTSTEDMVLDHQGKPDKGDYPGNHFLCLDGTTSPAFDIGEQDDIQDFKYYTYFDGQFGDLNPPLNTSASVDINIIIDEDQEPNSNYCGNTIPDPSFFIAPPENNNETSNSGIVGGSSGINHTVSSGNNNYTQFINEQDEANSHAKFNQSDTDIETIKFFPNPTDDFIWFKYLGEGQVILQIYNLQGQIVHQTRLKSFSEYQLNTKTYPEGLYIFELVQDKSLLKRGKILIVK